MKKQEKNAKLLQIIRPPPLIRRSCQLLIVDVSEVNSCHAGY